VSVSWVDTEDGQWSLIIEDTGPGLSPLPDASSPDRTRGVSGEGVGLAIVKRLCTLLEATLEIDSRPGVGTKFTITWPKSYPKDEELLTNS
jgi:two-component system CheB/CheR fusion protein